MKILFVIPELSLGGSERQLLMLATGLEALGHEVMIAVMQPAQRPVPTPSELDVRLLKSGPPHSFRSFLAVTRLIRMFRPDVVHSYLFGFDLWTNLAARCLNVKCIVATRRELATWRKRRHLVWQAWANALVDAVIANSLAAADYACATERMIERGSVYVVPNILDEACAKRGDSLAEHETPVILNVANFWPGKGQGDLVRVVALLRAVDTTVNLWLVGEGPERESVETLAAELNVSDAVTFMGRRDDVASLIQQADIYAHTSRMESSPNAILEAMGAGVPTVSYAAGGVPELVDGGDLGLLVDVGDVDQLAEGVAYLLDDLQRASDMAERARTVARDRHSLRACVQWHEQIYQRRTRDAALHQTALRVAMYTIGDMDSPSTRYRAMQYIPHLQEEGYEVEHFGLPSTRGGRLSQAFGLFRQGWIRRKQLLRGSEFDVVMVQKGLTPARWRGLTRQLKELGTPIIYDYDDAIHLATPIELPGFFRGWQDDAEPDELMSMAQCTIAGNDYLAAYARSRTEHVHSIPTVVDVRRYWDRTWGGWKSGDDLNLVWAGQKSTLPYLNAALPALDRVAGHLEEEAYKRMVLHVICDDFTSLDKHRAPGIYFDEVPWSLQGERHDLCRGDIGIMPLPDEEWAKGKCAFKAIQYMAMGILTLASSVGVNVQLIRHGVNGWLVESCEDLGRNLCAIANLTTQERFDVVREARNHIKKEYSLGAKSEAFIRVIQEVVQ